MTKGEEAKNYFLKGYSCSEAIVLAFKNLIDIDEKKLVKIASPFGGGMGRLRETCGAFSGILLVLGYLYGEDKVDIKAKSQLYQYVQELGATFKSINGFLRCRDILGLKDKDDPSPSIRDANYYQRRPCAQIIENATNILDEFIKKHPI